jgi:hypothetical protein
MANGVPMIEGILTTLGTAVANKKILGAWLILLSGAVAQIGEKVYIERTIELNSVEVKLDSIQSTLTDVKLQIQANSNKLDEIKLEQAKQRTELDLAKEQRLGKK